MRKMKIYTLAIIIVLVIAFGFGNARKLITNKTDKEVYAAESTKTTVVRVVDGDTLIVKDKGKEKTVRLIGVDTPESVATRDDLVNTVWGKKASNYTKKVLKKGKTVYLEYDKQKKDTYGRSLAYLYINKKKTKKNMYNNILIKKGYARAAYYAPNKKYRKLFRNSHKKAKKARKGFWGSKKTAKKSFAAAFPGKVEKSY